MLLDAFVYPTRALHESDPDLLKLCGARVLLDDRQLATPFLERLAELDRAGPPPLPESELRMRRVWAHKMLARIHRGDVEAHYRLPWRPYHRLAGRTPPRGVGFRGPKLALAALEREDPETFAAFARALAPGAGLDAIDALVACVIGPMPARTP